LGFPFNISATTEHSDFRIGRHVGFAKAITKSHPEEKVNMVMGYGKSLKFWGSPLIFLQRLKLAISNLVCSLGFLRPIIKSHAEEKWA